MFSSRMQTFLLNVYAASQILPYAHGHERKQRAEQKFIVSVLLKVQGK